MADAPVCHIPVDTPLTQPTGRTLAYIPPANDLKSALAAIAALRQNILVLTGQLAAHLPRNPIQPQPPSNTGSQAGGAKPPNSKPNNPTEGRWSENSRAVEKVRVFNPQDKSQYVDVLRINRLVMKDSVTGEQWVWDRGTGGGGEDG